MIGVTATGGFGRSAVVLALTTRLLLAYRLEDRTMKCELPQKKSLTSGLTRRQLEVSVTVAVTAVQAAEGASSSRSLCFRSMIN